MSAFLTSVSFGWINERVNKAEKGYIKGGRGRKAEGEKKDSNGERSKSVNPNAKYCSIGLPCTNPVLTVWGTR